MDAAATSRDEDHGSKAGTAALEPRPWPEQESEAGQEPRLPLLDPPTATQELREQPLEALQQEPRGQWPLPDHQDVLVSISEEEPRVLPPEPLEVHQCTPVVPSSPSSAPTCADTHCEAGQRQDLAELQGPAGKALSSMELLNALLRSGQGVIQKDPVGVLSLAVGARVGEGNSERHMNVGLCT